MNSYSANIDVEQLKKQMQNWFTDRISKPLPEEKELEELTKDVKAMKKKIQTSGESGQDVYPLTYEESINNNTSEETPFDIMNKYAKKNEAIIGGDTGIIYVKLADGTVVPTAQRSGLSKNVVMNHHEYIDHLTKKGVQASEPAQSPEYKRWSYDAPSFNVGGKSKYFDESGMRNTASDREFKKVDPCRKRNEQEDEFFKNINNIR